jgi:hypothetical protein
MVIFSIYSASYPKFDLPYNAFIVPHPHIFKLVNGH